MAALLVLVAITMGLYHWLGNPLNGLLNGVFQAGWLPLLPALVLIWLLAGKR